jgi:hypothetical protein
LEKSSLPIATSRMTPLLSTTSATSAADEISVATTSALRAPSVFFGE